jgi:hypothetical protein
VDVERLIDEAGEECLPVISALVEMYGAGLGRVVEMLPADEVGRLAQDPLVSHLLALHDLHPVSVDNRVREAISATGAYAVVESAEKGVVRVRASADKQEVIEQAIADAVPDVDAVEWADPLVVLPQVGG